MVKPARTGMQWSRTVRRTTCGLCSHTIQKYTAAWRFVRRFRSNGNYTTQTTWYHDACIVKALNQEEV